jgi:hypothetical protein
VRYVDVIGGARISAREVAAVIVALALAGVALRAWDTAHAAYKSIDAPTPSPSVRALGTLVYPRLAKPLVEARRIIPSGQTFSVRVGVKPLVQGYILQAVPLLFQYWLLPRRYTNDAHAADWVITFNHPASTLGVGIRHVYRLSRAVSAVEVAH